MEKQNVLQSSHNILAHRGHHQDRKTDEIRKVTATKIISGHCYKLEFMLLDLRPQITIDIDWVHSVFESRSSQPR